MNEGNGQMMQKNVTRRTGYHRNKIYMLEVRINLFIIKYLYNHLVNDDKFYSKGKRKSRKPFSEVLAGGDEGVFNGKWLSYVWNGENFTMPNNKCKAVSETFALDESYFRSKETRLIEIGAGITLNHWQSYFWKIIDKGDSYLNAVEKQQAAEVEKQLDNIVKCNLSDFRQGDPIYCIRHYFFYGERYDANATGKRKVKECIQLIKKIETREMDRLELDDLTEFEKTLSDTYEYVRAVKLIKTKKNQEIKKI